MLTKIKIFIALVKNMGARYVFLRFLYEVKSKLGLIKRKFPTEATEKKFISLNNFAFKKIENEGIVQSNMRMLVLILRKIYAIRLYQVSQLTQEVPLI